MKVRPFRLFRKCSNSLQIFSVESMSGIEDLYVMSESDAEGDLIEVTGDR